MFIDVVQFLECLREAKLPINLESIRDSLLIRSKDTLTMFMVEKIGRSTSPEQYLNMNAIRPKGLVAVSKTQAELEEYVGAEEHSAQKLQHDYYETFQSVEATNNITSDHPLNQDEEIERIVVEIYQTFPAAQTKIKCQKCGPLFKREGKKLFVFEQYRACWVGKWKSDRRIASSVTETERATISRKRRRFGRVAFVDLRKRSRQPSVQDSTDSRLHGPGSTERDFTRSTKKRVHLRNLSTG